MDRVFLPPISLHDEEHHYHPSAASSSSEAMWMNRSPSEWVFQRFLEESTAPDHTAAPNPKEDDVVEIKSNKSLDGIPNPNIPVDSEEYQTFLKSRLGLACAAVALTGYFSGIGEHFNWLWFLKILLRDRRTLQGWFDSGYFGNCFTLKMVNKRIQKLLQNTRGRSRNAESSNRRLNGENELQVVTPPHSPSETPNTEFELQHNVEHSEECLNFFKNCKAM